MSLIDKAGAFGKGVAYGTEEPHHYLNVRAKEMSAFPDEPAHFVQWLQANREPSIDPDSFLPRRLYGLYLRDCLETALQKTKCQFHCIQAEAVDLARKEGQIQLTLSEGGSLIANAVVLAMGVPPIKKSHESLERYIENIWEVKDFSPLVKSQQILIVGSGLTAVDALMSLFHHHYKGKIIVLSKPGRFPEPHQGPVPPITIQPPKTLRELFQLFRFTPDWRALIDGLRSHTPTLWAQLELTEKRRFLRHLFSLWNRHRHRMPPQCHQRILEALQEGQLQMVSGRFKAAQAIPEGIRLGIRATYKGGTLDADYLINCTGPDYAVAQQHNPLLDRAIASRLVQVDALGLGFCWSREGPIYPMGALLFGERLETTAVPELRVQAQEVANLLLRKY